MKTNSIAKQPRGRSGTPIVHATKNVTSCKSGKTAGAKRSKPPARVRETVEARRTRAAEILNMLRRLYPDATCALHHESPLQLLVATILSAQCTDTRVNLVTPELFRRYRTPAHYAKADPRELERMIQSTGFFRNKTKSLIGMGQAIAERFGGQVPETMEAMLELPGVARKTANVVLGTWFGKNEGVVVDTHVGRVATRLGLIWTSRSEKDAVRIEQDLMQLLPRDEWTFTSHALIWYGRRVCAARKPHCAGCDLAPHCPSAFTFGNAPESAPQKPAAERRGSAAKRGT